MPMTIRDAFRRLTSRVFRSVHQHQKAPRRLLLEGLEGRLVPSSTWYVNAAATGTGSGTTWTNAFTSLQPALGAAESGDQIWVATGTYKPTGGTDRTASFVLDDGVSVYGGFAGTEATLSRRSVTQNPTILSGDIGVARVNSDNSYHVVTATGLSAGVLDGFAITAGNASDSSTFPQNNGGGVLINSGTLTLSNDTFSNNSAVGDGGGLYSKGNPTLSDVTFSGNSAGYYGGGLASQGGTPTLTGVSFSGNSARYGGGADIRNSMATLTDVTFSRNTAVVWGGGMIIENGTAALADAVFIGNSAASFGGGGLDMEGGNATLTNVTFSGNSSARNGGGGLGNFWGSASLTNCILWGDSGGEIFGGATVSYSDIQGGYGGTGNLNADPLFVDPANGILYLRAGSPAIDTGTNTNAPARDIDNRLRPWDGNGDKTAVTDMGAYEFEPLFISSWSASKWLPGGSLTITGTGFSADGRDETVTIDGVAVTPISATTAEVTVLIPSGGGIDHSLQVTYAGQQSNAVSFAYAAPAIAAVAPAVVSPGGVLTITGTGFSADGTGESVAIGGVAATVTAGTATSVSVRVPAGGGIDQAVTVTYAGQVSNTLPVSYQPPAIASLSAAVVKPGDALTITGAGFSAGGANETVTIDGVPVTVTAATATSVTVRVPAGGGVNHSVQVTYAGQASNLYAFAYQPPAIVAVAPSAVKPGDVLTITGTGFSADGTGETVTIGGISAPVTAGTATSASVRVPAGGGIDQAVTITYAGQVSNTLPVSYQPPAITSLSAAVAKSGEQLTITGTGFSADGTDEIVTVDGAGVPLISATATQIVVALPAGGGANHSARVTYAGQSSGTDSFAYPLPAITSLSASAVKPGDSLVITGTGFSANGAGETVTIGGVSAPVTAATATAVTVTVPAGGGIDQAVTVTYAGQVSNTLSVSYQPPAIASLSAAVVKPGDALTITGTGFSAGGANETVTIDGVSVSITAATATSVTVRVPDGGGVNHSVQVTYAGQASNTVAVSYQPPVITGLSESTVKPGDVLTISGTGFSADGTHETVTIGGITVQPSKATATQLVVTAPLATGDNVPVQVSYDGQLSNTATYSAPRLVPTVGVSDAGGVYNGSTFPATVTVTGFGGQPGGSLEGVAPRLSYYQGGSATGTPLNGAPSGAGTYTVVATFPGSANYTAASAQATFTITPAQPGMTGLAGAPVVYGQAVVLTVTVAPQSGSGKPTGSVDFMDVSTGTALGRSPLSAGQASLTVSNLSAGSHTIVATYGGDNNFLKSTTTLTQLVSSTPLLENGVLALPGAAAAASFVLTPTLPAGATAYSLKVVRTVGSTSTNLGTFAVPGGVFAVYGGAATATVTLAGTANNDSFTVASNSVTEAASTANSLRTPFTILLDRVTGVTLQGGSGTDNLTGPDQANRWTITGGGSGTLNGTTAFTGMAGLTGGAGSDTFAFADGGSIPGVIGGGGGADTLDFSARTTGVTVTLAAGGPAKATATGGWTNIAAVVGSSAATDTLVGADTSNTWDVDGGNAGTVNGTLAFAGFENLTGGAINNVFAFLPGGSLAGNLKGGASTNTLDYSGYGGGAAVNLGVRAATGVGGTWSNVQTFLGSNAGDTLVGPNTINTWVITGADAGVIGVYSFSGFPNLTGGSGKDTFVVATGGSVTGTVDGSGGSNTLDESGRSSPVTLDLRTGTATAVGNWANVQTFVGTNTADTVIGADGTANTWAVKGTNAGTVGGVSFSGFANLTGGSGDDTFVLANKATVTGVVDGKGGSNTLDYSAYTSGVTVNLGDATVDLASHSATGINGGAANGVAGIGTVIVGAGNNYLTAVGVTTAVSLIATGNGSNVLIGGSGNNTLTVTGTGDNILVGGLGTSTLNGGGGYNLLIGGWTTYDTVSADWLSILGTWKTVKSAKTYAAAIANLTSPLSAFPLSVISVRGNATDVINAGTHGLDWYFAVNPSEIGGESPDETITPC